MRWALLLCVIAATWVAAEEHRRRKEDKHWKPAQDLEVKFPTTNGVARVVFSHERHFGALGAKNCAACHADNLGLGAGAFESHAGPGVTEPHAAKSHGRACGHCHNGVAAAGKLAVFTAFGRQGDAACERCHVPATHGADYTKRHGDAAEHGAQKCEACHRGSVKLGPTELQQAQAYREAQQLLAAKPDDAAAAKATLPNNFCVYCHAVDQRPWRGEH
jgi:hypothetical protein